MEQLIKVSENANGQTVVSARDLHLFLEATERFNNWFERQLQYGFVENQDFTSVKVLTLVNNGAEREVQDYALTLDCAKEISMVQRSEKGKQARLYFIECEKQLQSLALHSYQIEDPIKRAEKWIEEQKEKQQLALKAENLETALDALVEWVSILKVAQHNKVTEKAFKWQDLKAKSKEIGYEVKKAQSARFGYQNLYHVNCFRVLYPNYDYNFLKN